VAEIILIATGPGISGIPICLEDAGKVHPYCYGYRFSGPFIQRRQSFLLSKKCLERVYRRSAVLAAAGFQPEILP
jgi:hypothetical protein